MATFKQNLIPNLIVILFTVALSTLMIFGPIVVSLLIGFYFDLVIFMIVGVIILGVVIEFIFITVFKKAYSRKYGKWDLWDWGDQY